MLMLLKEQQQLKSQNKERKRKKADAKAYKKIRADEKAKGRERKKEADKAAYDKERALEKANERNQINKKMMKSAIGRRRKFFDSVRDGPIYGCVCCHRIRFRNGVVRFDDNIKECIFSINPSIIDKSIGTPSSVLAVKKEFYICLDCKSKLLNNKVPSLSHKNNLDLVDVSDKEELWLTELENCLIAKKYSISKICAASNFSLDCNKR